MVRSLTLALVGGLAALVANSALALETQAPAAPQAAVSAPAPVVAQPAPRRTYRRYSYNPTSLNSTRGYRSRAYQNGVRDAASKVLGVYQPFHR